MPYDVFISYNSSKDLPYAEALHRRLDAEGLKVWFDKARLNAGCDWHAEIEAGCEDSRVILPVLTPHWKESDWTKYETYGGESVIPLVCEGAWEDVITPPLERFQAERISAHDLEQMDWSRLVQAIRRACEKPEPERGTRTAYLRYRPNPCFVGREKDLNAIHEELHRNPRAVLTQGRVRAIAAMGGVGKTTLARHYAEKFWRCYQQMFWVDCRHVMESEFAYIYDLLFQSSPNSGLTPTEKAARALQELSGSRTRLLILDNAEDEKTVQDWIPKSGNCHTLLTSRFAGWSAAVKSMHLYLLEHSPALQLLERRIGRPIPGADREAAEILLQKLGYLPLAIEQAAAYINQQGDGFGCSDYLRLFNAATTELLSTNSMCSTEYPDPVITTWKSTIAQLTPGARVILQIMSFMSAAPLPVKLLFDAVEKIKLRAAVFEGKISPAPSNDEIWIRKELSCLKGYSMVETDGPHLSVHPLVQVVERLNMPGESRSDTLSLAMSCFAIHAPIDINRHEMQTLWRFLIPHAEEIKRHVQIQADVELHPRIQMGLGFVYYDQYRIREAIGMTHAALKTLKRENKAGSLDYFRCLQKMANMLDKKGKRIVSECLLRQAVAGLRETEGNEKETTLSALTDLANVLANCHKTDEARQNYTECMTIHSRALNSLSDSVLDSEVQRGRSAAERNAAWNALRGRMTALIGLGSVACDLDEYAEGERLLRLAVKDAIRLLGPKHPETAVAYGWLSTALFKQARYAEAVEWRSLAFTTNESVLGADHPTSNNSLLMLAIYTFASGNISGATEYFRRLCNHYLRVGGNEAVEIAVIAGRFAAVLVSAGNFRESREYAQMEYDVRVRCNGRGDPAAEAVLVKLIKLARLCGDAPEFMRLERERIALLDEARGREAPETISAINELAKHLESMDAFDEAEVEYRKALDRVPEDMVVLGNYAFFLQNFRRDFAGAQNLYLRALQADPNDAINHTNFAGLCLIMDNHAEAEEHLREAWCLAVGKADCYTARTLFLRAARAAVRKEEVAPYLGQLKTIFNQGIQPMPFRNVSVRDYLQQSLPPDAFSLLDALYAAINEPDGLAKLTALPDWQAITTVPLETPWPETST
ncbi:MAG TPA: tetratricopeptide repeat protein [Kiritimatiellia bacterium]|nr:tetratricopeptide repeat protein [Kiritimatiellia bacterium]HPS07098.1 tetratricopeptide repeat protein [Kiritimatiellia bacterium]